MHSVQYEIPKRLTRGKGYVEYDNVIDGVINLLLADEDINAYISRKFPELKRGDVIHLAECSTYRNDGKFLWDGEQLVDLDYDTYDPYGQVPKSFKIEFFGPKNFFESTIAHNSIVRIDGRHYNIEEIFFIKDTSTYRMYQIVHAKTDVEWFIISPHRQKAFEKELRVGMFCCDWEHDEEIKKLIKTRYPSPKRTLYSTEMDC